METNIGPDDDEKLSKEVLDLCSRTSDKFVPIVKKDDILKDILIMLKKFRTSARWREFFHKRRMRELNRDECDQIQVNRDSDLLKIK